MKKILAAFTAIILMLCVFASAEIIPLPEYGLELEVPDDSMDMGIALQLNDDPVIPGVYILYCNYERMNAAEEAYMAALASGDEAIADDAINGYVEAYMQSIAEYCAVVSAAAENAEETLAENGIENMQLIGANSTRNYYIIPGTYNEALTAEDAERMEAARETAEAIAASVKITEIIKPDAGDGALGNFTTVDMDGNEVTQDIFGNADLTIVNIWGTYCNPCIGEMPELAEWAKELPENIQIIGMLVDVSSPEDRTFSTARKIIEKAGVGYTNLLLSESLMPFMNTVTGVPTTLFIDRNGEQVHEMIVGAYVEKYKQVVEEFQAK